MEWQEYAGSWVTIPSRPIAIIHFLGGAFVGAAPHITYRRLLETLAAQGYVIVATPFVNAFDHCAIAEEVLVSFDRVLDWLYDRVLRRRSLPIYGLGHSMGCKLHLLIGSLYEVDRAGNILMAFNNFAAREAIPLLDQFTQLAPTVTAEFTPSPEATQRLIVRQYPVRRNLLIQFRKDTLDQTTGLSDLLQRQFADLITYQILPGTHLTPLGSDLTWTPGETFTPLDAIGQWVKQEVFRELNHLEDSILRWLKPLGVR